MNYIGIDLSFTGTGLVILNEDCSIKCQDLLSTTSKLVIEERITTLVESIMGYIDPYDTPKICIEGLSYSSRGQSTLDLAGLHFYLRTILYKEHHCYYIIPPNMLKKSVTGTGRCQKNLMLLKCYKKYGVEFSDDNLCDAYCLARFSIENYKEKEK